MKLTQALFGAAFLAASTLSFAQAPAPTPPAPQATPKTDAQKAERREKMKAAHEDAKKACEGKQGDERHKCMTDSMCAKAPNPQACQERSAKMKERHHERREKIREACKGKQGDELKACIKEQRGKK